MRPADDIKKQIRALKIQADAELDEKLYRKFRQATDKQKTSSAEYRPISWRIIMHSKITKLAMAAIIAIVAVVGIKYFGGPIDVASPAFADVMEQIYKVKNVSYTETMITPNGTFVTSKTADESGILRIDAPEQGWFMLFDFPNGLHLNVFPNMKKCYITHSVGREHHSKPFIWLNWVQKMHYDSAKYTGTENTNGQTLETYIIEVPFEKTTIWVNPVTDLPVKIIMAHYPNPTVDIKMPTYSLNKKDFGGSENESVSGSIGSGRGSGLGISDRTTQIMTDFLWDQKLDLSLFTFEPDQDWEIIERQQQDSEIAKEDLIKALSFWTEMTGGRFPERINDLTDPNLLNTMLIEKYNIGGNPNEQFEQAQKEATVVIRGLYFAQEKKVQDNWHYAGADAVFGDSQTPIAWWQDEDADSWTVIYADLSIGETNASPKGD